MKRPGLFLLIFTITVLQSFQKKNSGTTQDFFIQQLAPGVWAAIQNDHGGHAISNAGIIDLGDKTLVFDAFINQFAAAELKKIAEQLTHHPVAFVINSHFHDDHIRGNQAFAPGASIISTEWTKKEMQQSEPEEQDWARKNIATQLKKAKEALAAATGKAKDEALMWVGYYEAISQSLPSLKTVLPNITFTDSMWIHGNKRSVLLLGCKNGHTGSDAVMILPKEGIAFMGDILFAERHPWFGDGDAESLKQHLQRFYADTSLQQFVPGHGPVCKKEKLEILIQYISTLQQMALDAVQKNEPDSIFLKTPIPEAYKDWWYGRFYKDNLDAVYQAAAMKK